MKCTMNVSKLLEGLKPALLIATKDVLNDVQTASHLTLKFSKTELIATAHGCRLAGQFDISDISVNDLGYSCDKEGDVTIDANYLASALGSFRVDSEVIFECDGPELKISLKGDKDEFQTLATLKDEVELPIEASAFDKELTIDRDIFINGLKTISYALDAGQERELFHYWALRVDKKKARFVGGASSRFAVLDISGDSFVQSSAKLFMLFHRDQREAIKDILELSDVDKITIKQASRNKDHREQIVFGFGIQKLIMVSFDPNVSYVNEDKFLKNPRPLRLRTKVEDWQYAAKGMMATYTKEFKASHDTYPAEIHIDVNKKLLTLKTDTPFKASRKIPITEVISNDNSDDQLDIRCAGPYLNEMAQLTGKDEEIELHIGDPEKEPIIIRHSEKSNQSRGVSEVFTTFFSTLHKDE